MFNGMLALFANLKSRPLLHKAALMFVYGLLSFGLLIVVGSALANPLLFRIVEFLWFVHILVVANQLSYGNSDLMTLAILGLSPGLLNNVLAVLSL